MVGALLSLPELTNSWDKLPCEHTFHIQTSQPNTHHFLYLILTHQPASPVLNHPGPCTRQLDPTPVTQSPTPWSKPSHPKFGQSGLPCLTHFFPRKSQKRAWAKLSPCAFNLLTNPGASSCGQAWGRRTPVLGNCHCSLSSHHTWPKQIPGTKIMKHVHSRIWGNFCFLLFLLFYC